MNYLTQHWSFDPFLILAMVVAGWHEVGLWRLARRSRPERTRERRLRSLWFYAGLAVLLIAVSSPIDYWSDDYFIVHMVQHLLLMFAAPTLIVAGAPWQPLLAALPGRSGRSATRGVHGGRLVPAAAGGRRVRAAAVGLGGAVQRRDGRLAPARRRSTWPSSNQAVHVWLMDGSFFAAGVLFWLQFIPSPPFRRRMPLASQAAALLVTNVVMIGIAMALSIFVSDSVYPVYDHVPGVTLPPFADQQIGAAILWVCGDFWALPTMIVVVRRLIVNDGSITAALDRLLSRGSVRGRLGHRAAGRGRAERRAQAQRPRRRTRSREPDAGGRAGRTSAPPGTTRPVRNRSRVCGRVSRRGASGRPAGPGPGGRRSQSPA